MNCKFKFHLRAALPRGAARDWLGLPDWLRLVEALPDLVGADGPVAPLKWAGLPAVPMRRYRTWWALPGRWAPPAGGMRFTVLRIPRVRARKPSSLALRAGGREPGRPAGSFFRIFRSTVRARKPNSLALRAGGREPGRRPGSFFRIFRSAVRARKPNSLALRAGGREPCRPAGFFFRIFRSAVRARKPNSLALRAGGREPRRLPSRVQMKRDARKAPGSVHLFPLLYFQKERIDDELTLSPRRRQF